MALNIGGNIINNQAAREIEYNSTIQEGLVCYLDGTSFVNVTGNTWYDFSNNGKHGTLISGPTISTSGYVTFDGTDDYVSIGQITGDFSNFTVCVWFYPTSVTNYENVIDCNYSYNGNTGNIGPRFEMNSSGTSGWVFSGEIDNNNEFQTVEITSSGLSQNQWHFTALSRTSSNSVIGFLDGSVTTTTLTQVIGTVNTSFVNVFNNVIVGKGFHLGGGDRIFTGRVGIVQIYNRALSSDELLKNYNTTKHRYL
jgi:hypothetical protein